MALDRPPVLPDPASLREAQARSPLLTVLRLAVLLVALFSAAEWAHVVLIRVRDPYPVEWMEGAVVAHALRHYDGLAIYVPPSADFIPALYPPLGYWVQAWVMRLLGPGLPAARAASVMATLGVTLLLGLLVHRWTRSIVAAVAVAGIFLDAYVTCGAWYDLARNDMLFLCFGLASIFVVTGHPAAWRTWTAALLAALAVWTRQQGIAFVAAGFLYLMPTSRRRAVAFVLLVAAFTIPGFLFLERESGGWFMRTVWTTLGDYPLRYRRLPGVFERIAAALWIPLLGATLWFVRELRRRLFSPQGLLWASALGAFLLNAVLAMIKEGGDVNHLIPVVVLALLLAGFALGELDRDEREQRAGRWPPWILGTMLVLLAVQYFVWPHPSRALVPDRVRAAQRHVVTEIAAIPGAVFALDDPYYLRLAGKPLNADGGAIFWLSYEGLDLPVDLVARLAGEHYAAVLLAEPVELGLHARTASGRRVHQLVRDHYVLAREVGPADPALDRLRVPRYIYLPRGGAREGQHEPAPRS